MPDPITVGLYVGGAIISGIGGNKKAKAAKKAARIRQRMMEEAAVEVIAVGQRAAKEEERQADLIASRALAVGAASGGGGSQITDIIADIEGEGAYRAAVQMYNAESKARKLRLEGYYGVEQAKSDADAIQLGAFGSIFSLGAGIADISRPRAKTS